MSYLQESLGPGEKIEATFDLHWTAKWKLIVFVILVLPTFGIALIGVIYEWLRLRAIELAVTDRRVVHKTGIISRQTEELRLASIETIDLNQSAMGRLLGYGDVMLTGRGESDLIFKQVADPIGVKRAIESAYSTHAERRTTP